MPVSTKKRVLIAILISLLVFIFALFIIFRGRISNTALTSNTKKLKSVEVKEYKGKKLSSTEDFRENAIKGPQYIDRKDYRLKIVGLVKETQTHTYNEVIKDNQLYKKVVTLDCVEGWSVTILWEGILVKDLLKEAGVSSKAKVVIFHAHEGYTTSLPLDYIMEKDIIMAYKMNGVVLPPERGFPFQLVAEDKWGYKWIKWIEKIEVSDDVNYKGYWEKRGYSNEADLDKDFLE